MPLFRIETRPRDSERPARRARPSRAAGEPAAGPPLRLAVVLGASAGVILVAGFAYALLQRRPALPVAGVAVATGTPGMAVATGAAATSAAAGSTAASGQRYRPGDIIAWVNGETYTYEQLLRAVRIARVLSHFTGDAVPSDTSPEMPAFQVQMLRRQIDLILLKQAMRRDQTSMPEMDGEILLEGFLRDSKVDRAELARQLEANGVTEGDLTNWLADASAVNFYIQSKVAPGKQGPERDAAVQAWLNAEWDARDIKIRFYDPDEVFTPTAPAQPTPAR